MKISRSRARVILVVLLAAPLLGISGSADAAFNRGCVSKAEYGRVHRGMTVSRINSIFGTSGRVLFRNPGTVSNGANEYRVCPAWARSSGKRIVQVQYNNYAAHGGPMRAVYIQRY